MELLSTINSVLPKRWNKYFKMWNRILLISTSSWTHSLWIFLFFFILFVVCLWISFQPSDHRPTICSSQSPDPQNLICSLHLAVFVTSNEYIVFQAVSCCNILTLFPVFFLILLLGLSHHPVNLSFGQQLRPLSLLTVMSLVHQCFDPCQIPSSF